MIPQGGMQSTFQFTFILSTWPRGQLLVDSMAISSRRTPHFSRSCRFFVVPVCDIASASRCSSYSRYVSLISGVTKIVPNRMDTFVSVWKVDEFSEFASPVVDCSSRGQRARFFNLRMSTSRVSMTLKLAGLAPMPALLILSRCRVSFA